MDAKLRPKVGIKATLIKADGTRVEIFDKKITDEKQVEAIHNHIQNKKESE